MLSNEDWSCPEGGRCSCGTEGCEEVRRGEEEGVEEGERDGKGGGEKEKERGRENLRCKRPLSACCKWYVLHIVGCIYLRESASSLVYQGDRLSNPARSEWERILATVSLVL